MTPGTDYTYHAFAAVSNDTVLGNEVTFTTNPEILTRLDTLTGPYEAQDGDILVGTLASPYKITIAPSATVTLRDATISPSGTASTGTTNEYAGITCDGNATILLEGTNTVKGFNTNYPGINGFFNWVESQSYKIQYRVMLARYRGKTTCPECKGTRLRPDANLSLVRF